MALEDTDRIVKFVRDPSLGQVELRYSEYKQPVFHRHNHDAYSIGLVKKGRTQFHLVQQVEVTIPASPGDVVLINPGEVHACNPETGSIFAYFMLYLAPEYFLSMVADYLGLIVSTFSFTNPILKDTEISHKVDELCFSMMSGGTRLEIETLLHESMAGILEKCDGRSIDPRKTGSTVKVGYAHLMDHVAENISLQELAGLCNLSPFHFLRSFRRQYGLPPHTCQLQMRINQARRLLADGKAIADVAAVTGFADQSHFSRQFKRSVGATPLQYQTNTRN